MMKLPMLATICSESRQDFRLLVAAETLRGLLI